MIGATNGGVGGGEFTSIMVPPLRPVVDGEVVEKENTINSVEEEAGDSGSDNLDSPLERSETIPGRDGPTFSRALFLYIAGKKSEGGGDIS